MRQTRILESERTATLAVALRDVRVAYRSGDRVVESLRGVSLDVSVGDFLAVQGPSGSGKSSLLKAMAGLVPIASGEVFVEGLSISARSDDELAKLRRRRIGFVHQQFNLLPDLTVAQNVGLPLMLDGRVQLEVSERVQTVLARLGMSGFSDRLPEELSGGEMLRVALARALAIEPLIVLADEPTGSLDRKNSRSVIELFREVHSAAGATFVIVTHDAEVAAGADQRVRLEDGRIAA